MSHLPGRDRGTDAVNVGTRCETGTDLRLGACTVLACLSADAIVDGIGSSNAYAETECVGKGCATLLHDLYLAC